MAIQMDWIKLLSPKRFGFTEGSTQESETRSHFQRDYDRIIFSSPFRRLQNKTQVFPLPGSVFVHNRLTHSLEVASVGRSLGNNLIPMLKRVTPHTPIELIEQIPTIVSTACLAHDLGNPPFGHSGEEAIRTYFKNNENLYAPILTIEQWTDLTRFEGNANALRLLTKKFEGRRDGGYRLSYPVLSSIVKYPWESTFQQKKKFGFFQAEIDTFINICEELGVTPVSEKPRAFARHPLVYLVEAADDICYQIMDIEDAHRLGIVSTNFVIELFSDFFNPSDDSGWLKNINQTLSEVSDTNEKLAFLRAVLIGKLVRDCTCAFEKSLPSIMRGEVVPPLIEQLDGPANDALQRLRKISIEQVYNHRTVVEIELAGYQVIGKLLEKICPALLSPNQGYSKKVLKLIPNQYLSSKPNSYESLLSAVDYVAGMTDVYALELYRTLEGITIPGIS